MAIAKAYARLEALRQNLPEGFEVHEKYVNEYHAILSELEVTSGFGLWEFRVPPSEVRPSHTGGNYLTREEYYSDEKYCDRSFLLMKLDGVLSFFTFVTPGREAKRIGFVKA